MGGGKEREDRTGIVQRVPEGLGRVKRHLKETRKKWVTTQNGKKRTKGKKRQQDE